MMRSAVLLLLSFFTGLAVRAGEAKSEWQPAERRCRIFATGALDGTVFALLLGFVCIGLPLVFQPQRANFTMALKCTFEIHERVSALCALSYCAASMLFCRFFWRQVRRWRELPAFLVPFFGFVVVAIGTAMLDYLNTFYGIPFQKMIMSLCGFDVEETRILLAVCLLAVAVGTNLPAAVKVLGDKEEMAAHWRVELH